MRKLRERLIYEETHVILQRLSTDEEEPFFQTDEDARDMMRLVELKGMMLVTLFGYGLFNAERFVRALIDDVFGFSTTIDTSTEQSSPEFEEFVDDFMLLAQNERVLHEATHDVLLRAYFRATM